MLLIGDGYQNNSYRTIIAREDVQAETQPIEDGHIIEQLQQKHQLQQQHQHEFEAEAENYDISAGGNNPIDWEY